jgi:tyrosyl-tRNA synthetase
MSEQLLDLLSHNTQETIGLSELLPRIEEEKTLNLYWGAAPTRMPSVAYLVPLIKLRDCILSGKVNVTIFLADLHSYMDKGFDNVSRVQERTNFYEFILSEMMTLLGISPDRYKIVRGSNVQLTPQYMTNLLKFTTIVNAKDAKHAGKEVVKQNDQPMLSSLIYPLMQCLDEVALNTDIQLGGLDQRKIFMLGRDFMPKLGFRKCVYLMNPLIPSLLKGCKMSSSDPKGKLEFTDSTDDICEKIKKAFCVDTDINLSTNPCLSILKHIIFPIRGIVSTSDGQCMDYRDFESMWILGTVKAQELKSIVAKEIDGIIAPLRIKLAVGTKGGDLYDLAYKWTNDQAV